MGLYSLSPNADLEGPGSVTDIDIAFEGAALSGTITFKLPTTTVSGNKLSGDINYTVEIDDETLSSGTSTAGSLVELPITLSEGNHTLGITTHTIHGTGPAYKASFYVGTDTPATVTGITVNRESDNVTIAWEAVTKGQHGGYVDISLLTYNVIRKPDNKIIATRTTETTVTDTELPLILGEYTYEIIVSDGTRQSDPALSDGIMLGSYLEPPYNHSFKSMDSFDQYTIINANEDDKAWTATVNGAQLNYSRTLAADDWIVSPAMKLKAGFLYTLILKGRSSSATYKERFEVKYGTEATADALTNVIIEPNFFTTSKEETFQAVFSPQSDGTYYIGIHGISDKYMGSLYIYSIEITEPTNALAPAATDEMNAVAAPEGALGATISATVPSKRADGSNLTTIAKAEIWNKTKERLVGSIDNPQPGSEVSITDTQAANGFNTYSIASLMRLEKDTNRMQCIHRDRHSHLRYKPTRSTSRRQGSTYMGSTCDRYQRRLHRPRKTDLPDFAVAANVCFDCHRNNRTYLYRRIIERRFGTNASKLSNKRKKYRRRGRSHTHQLHTFRDSLSGSIHRVLA